VATRGRESYTGFGYRRAGEEWPHDRADLLQGDVAVGDELPELAYPVTATTSSSGLWPPATGDRCTTTRTSPSTATAPATSSSTPEPGAWFERYITDWTGPYGRLQRVTFRMLGSIFPGDTMVFRGTVTDTGVDDTGCAWVAIAIAVSVDDDPKTTCTARVALPVDADDNRGRAPATLDALTPHRTPARPHHRPTARPTRRTSEESTTCWT